MIHRAWIKWKTIPDIDTEHQRHRLGGVFFCCVHKKRANVRQSGKLGLYGSIIASDALEWVPAISQAAEVRCQSYRFTHSVDAPQLGGCFICRNFIYVQQIGGMRFHKRLAAVGHTPSLEVCGSESGLYK